MRTTVTGADGFVGQWLLRRLLADGDEVTAMIRLPAPQLTTLEPALAGQVQWRACELADVEGLRGHLRGAKPDAIFHLAAQSSVPASNQDPMSTFQTNVIGTVHLLEAARAVVPDATVVAVGSADAYGAVAPDQLPLREDAPLRPSNPYAASKAAAEIIALQYARAGWNRVIATRSFNHTGPGQSASFAVAAFAKQIADIKHGRCGPQLHVGNLESRRDISDVRDVVEAYALLARRGRPGLVYNVCSGRDHSMREIIDELLRIGGVRAEIHEDPALARSVENPVLRGDPSRITADTGWQARIPLATTLTDVLEYYAHVAA
jgi:GDP-4-dehydro-6-deoxy-D-mannose reductase